MAWPDPFTRKSTVKVGNLDIHVAEAGDGPPVVLLHGNPDTHSVWASVVGRLAPAHRCIAPDLPGFGRSTPADFELTLDLEAGFVRGLADALDLPRMHLVVHDVGGPFGLAFATLHPERIASLTIFDTIFSADYRWHFWGRVWRTRGLGELAMVIANRPLFVRELRRGSANIPRDYAEHAWTEFHKTARRTVLRWYRASDPARYTGWDARFREATAGVPKQVLWGERDPFIPPRFGDTFGVPPRRFPELGHWLMLEDPDTAANAITELVARSAAT